MKSTVEFEEDHDDVLMESKRVLAGQTSGCKSALPSKTTESSPADSTDFEKATSGFSNVHT